MFNKNGGIEVGCDLLPANEIPGSDANIENTTIDFSRIDFIYSQSLGLVIWFLSDLLGRFRIIRNNNN
ncbi:MAG: hypothetical protein J5I59_00605 [Saprospiraceae bacterium]|nr:hypothetical protein [Saprospiraceae bacterium]